MLTVDLSADARFGCSARSATSWRRRPSPSRSRRLWPAGQYGTRRPAAAATGARWSQERDHGDIPSSGVCGLYVVRKRYNRGSRFPEPRGYFKPPSLTKAPVATEEGFSGSTPKWDECVRVRGRLRFARRPVDARMHPPRRARAQGHHDRADRSGHGQGLPAAPDAHRRAGRLDAIGK